MKYIANLIFPEEYVNHKYALIHFNFFLQYAKLAKINVNLVKSNNKVFIASGNKLYFSCIINDKQVIIDYSDHYYTNWAERYQDLPYFKFQTTSKTPNHIIPLGPPMIGVKQKGSKGETVRSYFNVAKSFDYTPGNSVLCKQFPNGNATNRRLLVHDMLKEQFNNTDTYSNDDQLAFWNKHENCGVAVCVPGANNNMIDRGQMELFGLGVCTVSPRLNTILPNNITTTPNVHYIKCNDDYSNLIEVIHTSLNDKDFLKTIGNNAKQLFNTYFTPQRYWEWILKNL